MHAFLLGSRFYDNINALFVCFCDNINICGGTAVYAGSVGADVIRACGHFMQPCNLF